MFCYKCGGKLERIVTDLPFKISRDTIVIIKKIPVLQCQNCHEYLIEDAVMEKIDYLLGRVDKTAELEIFSYKGSIDFTLGIINRLG